MGNYEECITFLNKLGIELFEYQKEILKAFIENKTVQAARGIGRTFVANCYGKYIAHILSNNDYSKKPDVIVPYDEAVKCGLLSEDFIKRMHNIMTQEEFNKEFLCK